MTYLPRDFIETAEGFIFAVVDSRLEEGRILCFLRYASMSGRLRKLGTAAANARLAAQAPGFLYCSRRLDARLHGVPHSLVLRHYRPRERARELLGAPPRDALEAKAVRLLELFSAQGIDHDRVGVTGSLLIGAQTAASDLDLVIYGRDQFFAARSAVQRSVEVGELEALDAAAWRAAYERRDCALGFEDYLWHERRKFNKALIRGTKFDITLIGEDPPLESGPVQKLGAAVIRAKVADARYAYDFPATYRLDHPEVAEALSFTQTYAGQAEAGETVEIAGMLEQAGSGQRRIVVGASREAPGEYIKVSRSPEARFESA
jgi:predicted nucleotidyltransferase